MVTNNENTRKMSIDLGMGEMIYCHGLPKQNDSTASVLFNGEFYAKHTGHGN